MKGGKKQNAEGRFAYDGLDRVIHEKARLGLLTCLAGADDGLTFGELKRLCDLTDGNLNRHLKQLVEADLVRLSQDDSGPRRQTLCELTADGRKKFLQYLSELERVVSDAGKQMKRSPASRRRLASD